MASSLTADSFYNLSNQHQFNYNNNKEFIYVKLTDSALRAIEDYVKNQSKFGPSVKPLIQFHGNEGGLLSFPGVNGNNQPIEQKFSFSLTEEEKQGSFECLQQNHGQINVLGGIQHRMRVQAQEDVYEKTRASMTIAAQTKNQKCAREIKPNQTDIGKKVTKKLSPINSSSSIYNNRTSTSGQSSSVTNSLISNNSNKRPHENNFNGNLTNNGQHSTSSLYSQSQTHSHSYNQANSSPNLIYQTNSALNGVVGDDVEHQRTSLTLNSSRSNGLQNHRIPDITKKPIKERLIHLLALRPYKKPELYDRLLKEGISNRDKNIYLNVLKSISYLRDNTYLLHRHLWNDVHEDWPFYSDQDRSTLKRRKPQNLTPPLSSDGGSSSTSGQSPNSQHNGSPPPAVKRPSQAPMISSNALNIDDDNYFEPVKKKVRISHLVNGRPASNYESTYLTSHSRTRDSDDYYGSNSTPNSLEDSGLGMTYSTGSMKQQRYSSSSNISNGVPIKNGNINGSQTGTNGNDELCIRMESNGDIRTNGTSQSSKISNNFDSVLNSYHHEDESQSTRAFSDYPPISSVEVRRRYKTEFDKDYAEYRQLHRVMDKARQRFAGLHEELNAMNPSDRRYKEIENQIVQEYRANNTKSSFSAKKQKFDYLHKKLSHIKKLVSDFDSRIIGQGEVSEPLTKHVAY